MSQTVKTRATIPAAAPTFSLTASSPAPSARSIRWSREAYGIGGEVYVADLDFTTIEASLAEERVFHSLPRFPAVTRDLALVCDEALTVGELERCISAAAGKLLRKINLFDIYRGPGVARRQEERRLLPRAARATTGRSPTRTPPALSTSVLKALKEEKDVTLR